MCVWWVKKNQGNFSRLQSPKITSGFLKKKKGNYLRHQSPKITSVFFCFEKTRVSFGRARPQHTTSVFFFQNNKSKVIICGFSREKLPQVFFQKKKTTRGNFSRLRSPKITLFFLIWDNFGRTRPWVVLTTTMLLLTWGQTGIAFKFVCVCSCDIYPAY